MHLLHCEPAKAAGCLKLEDCFTAFAETAFCLCEEYHDEAIFHVQNLPKRRAI
ncbi:hypothetical protein [Seleniivibrio woodruffii]|uniref:hypothetical protein n=1 Tax=Seleniivibrio woodruffii TaxID=1078050 RepID=UPI0024095C5B|nr:hypothetical protein [Seleniivibrio woodruffii]